MVLFEGQVGRLGGLTRQGCTFHPEELGTLSRYRAERYIPLRDTYQLLYRLEMQNEIEYKGLRRKLNGCYENFTALLGDLNKKENAAFILNDPGGREVLGLERFVEGRKQLSDILRRPVSFDPYELKHVDTAAEALARLAQQVRTGGVFLYGVARIALPARADRRAGRSHFL